MTRNADHVTRRTVMRAAPASAAALWLAACGAQGPAAGGAPGGPPVEVVWARAQAGEPQDSYWKETARLAEQATRVKVTLNVEAMADFWTKRQAEFAAGTTGADIIYNQLNWVLPGGLAGMFVDHYEYLRRDKVDTKQYYKADLDSWGWKGKLWAIPYTSGGEVVLFNKKLFDAKGVKHPTKDWTYDDLLQACQRLNDPASTRFAVEIGQNGLQYMMGTFVRNFGGKIVNDTRDRALYGDDANAIRGAELDVDLQTRHRVTPTAEALKGLPSGQRPLELQMTAMEFNGLFRHVNVRAAIGAENLDFAPPPRGPTGIQQARVAGNAWSIPALSKVKDAAWRVLKWTHTREGLLGPQLDALSWPPLIWAASAPQWLDRFKGTHIGDCAKVWETGGHNLVLPEGNDAITLMNAPLTRALNGEIATREAMRESADKLNELFGRRPAAWK